MCVCAHQAVCVEIWPVCTKKLVCMWVWERVCTYTNIATFYPSTHPSSNSRQCMCVWERYGFHEVCAYMYMSICANIEVGMFILCEVISQCEYNILVIAWVQGGAKDEGNNQILYEYITGSRPTNYGNACYKVTPAEPMSSGFQPITFEVWFDR